MKTNPTPITRTDYQDNGLLQMQQQQIEMNKQETKTPEQKCKEEGGIWDAEKRTCIRVQKKETEQDILKQQVEQQGGYINEEGTYIPDTRLKQKKIDFNDDGTINYTTEGQTYKLTRDEYNALQSKAGGKTTQNVQEIKAIEGGQLEQIRLQQIASQMGLNENQIAAIQSGLVEAPIDWGQAITSGVMKAVPNAIAGAIGGGAIGLATGGVASVPLAIAGGVGGLLQGIVSGIQSNIKLQQKGEIDKANEVLSSAKKNLGKLASLVAKDPQNAGSYMEIYNEQLAQVYQAYRQLQLETQGNLNKFMDDGSKDLEKFALFLAPNGLADNYRRNIEIALLSGQVPPLSLEDFA